MDIQWKLQHLPQQPGVYLFKDNHGKVLYVGKAKNLKNRVRTYFLNGRDLEPRLRIMLLKIADLDYTVVSSETEALMLENNLIKEYQPRFNVLMRDDKNYQFIKIDYSYSIPQIYTVRKIDSRHSRAIRKFKSQLFGPYTSGLAVKDTLHLLKLLFHLCRNKKITAKPCFAFHLGRCPGVCFGKIPLTRYRQTFQQIEGFLRHRQAPVLKTMRAEMLAAARQKKFEQAANARDKIRALEHLWQRQKIVSPKNENSDFLGLYLADREAAVALLAVREGRLIHREHFRLEHQEATSAAILERFISQYYAETSDRPREIYLPTAVSSPQFFPKIKFTIPVRGRKKNLLDLAAENAKLYAERERATWEKTGDKLLTALQKTLGLSRLPLRIEGYDISNIQGTNPAGSMVVFTNGQADKSQYRKFKITIPETPNDFAMMREMLERRFKHSSSVILRYPEGSRDSSADTPQNEKWKEPDLIVIDGGKGQLNVATEILTAYHLQFPHIGLAKRLEEIFIPGQKKSLILPPTSPALFLLQRIRDEAHRFAITFYRARHRARQTLSHLEDIAGIGPATRRKLLKRFGSTAGIRQAEAREIADLIGQKLAKKIKELM